ncbi:hypothetical protein IJ732_00805 [bacterium]|nr:hypothetical protein [bacterium]
MGMAASQARYIELAARKTNVEYEGQQINQQRTALANESAGLFNKMLQLNVPTAPNYNQFVKTIYTFSDGTNDYTIDSFSRTSDDPSFNAKVNYYYTTTEYTGMYKERSDLDLHWEISPTSGETLLYYGTKKLDAYNAQVDEAAVRQIYENTYLNASEHPIMDGDKLKTSYVGANYAAWLADPSSVDLSQKIYSYQSGGTKYYISVDNMDGTKQTNTALTNTTTTIDTSVTPNQTTITITDGSATISTTTRDTVSSDVAGTRESTTTYTKITAGDGTVTYVDVSNKAREAGDVAVTGVIIANTVQPVQNCYSKELSQKKWQKEVKAYLDKDDSGNYKSITLENYSNTFDMNVYQETDDVAYNQAMNDYVYQKAMYDKNIADINAKTEIIQQEDRTLELKLKQLDTEHNALQTEMDAVKKVCDKNVESTFKTFSG